MDAEQEWRNAEALVRMRQPTTRKPRPVLSDPAPVRTAEAWQSNPPFTAATAYAGFFNGFTFTHGEQGLGYYAENDRSTTGPSNSEQQRPIALAQLIPPPAPATAAAPRPPARRRRNANGTRWKNRPRTVLNGCLPLPLSADNPWHAVADFSWRANGLWAIDTANTNAWGTALQYLAVTAADVCLLQEHRLHGEEVINRATAAARHKGWQCKPNEALRTGAAACATSSGTAVAAKKAFGYYPSSDKAVADGFSTRISHAWTSVVCRGGIHIVSIYLKHTEELSPDNLAILDAAAQLIDSLRGPWLLAGDFNMEPATLQAGGFLDLVHGQVFAPSQPTCKQRCYDYFVVSSCLAPFVHSVTTLGFDGINPHAPVRLLLRGDARRLAVKKLVRPGKVAAVLQHGPTQNPELLPPLHDERSTHADTDAALRAWQDRADAEFAQLGASRPADGHKPPRIVWACPLGPITDPSPGADQVSVVWRNLARKTAEAARHLAADSDAQQALAIRCANNALATAKWAVGRQEFVEFHVQLSSWIQSLTAASQTRCAEWIGRISKAAHNHEQQQCARNRTRQRTAWQQHFRHGGDLLAGGYAPTRRAFLYVRGPMGWTQAPTAPAIEEDDLPEVEVDHHDDHLVKAAELYQEQGSSLSLLRNATASNVSTVLSPQAEVEAEANRWAAEWNEGAMYAAPFPHITECPPTLIVQAILLAAATFAPLTGLGADNVSPRAYRRLTDQALLALAHILRACEMKGTWPSSIFAVLIVLLPKPDGGRRPIGLFDSKIRLWMRIRSQVARMWEAANPSPAIFGGRGCGAQRAAWLSSLTAENAHLAKQEYAQTLIDLVKAFERIPHHVLVAFAIKWQYCLMTLRLSLTAYRLARIICIDSVCSRFVTAARGITAGAGMATSELRLFMLDLITSSLRLFPWVRHTLYVDDLTLERRGTVEAAPRQLADATDFAVRYLQEKLLAEVSPTKTVYLTSSRHGARKFRGRLKTSKVKFTKSTKLLGTQTVAGKRRSTAILRGRLQSFKKKIPRIQRLRAAGINVRQITSAVGVPAFFYGAQCSGVSDTHLEAARRDVAKAVGTSTRGSHHDRALYMSDVAGSRLDPAFDAHALPLQYYALAWWESWAEPYELRQHFASAWRKLAAAKWNWNQVTGPITAVLATANRLKWHFTSAHRVVTDQDRVLDLLRDPPAYVVKQVNAAVRRWQLARVIRLVPNLIQRASTTTYSGAKITSKLLPADVIADSKALSSLLGSRRGIPKDVKGLWTRDSRPWLHSTAIGAQWPQARVAAVPGWSDDSSCQLCGHIPGNLAHRAQCPGNTPCGGWPAPSAMAQAGLDRLSQQQRDILLGTGLMVVQLPIPAPPQLEEIQWLLPLDASTAPDDIRWYIDGSLIDPMTPFQRVGAGLVGIAGDRPVAIATATPPEWIDTIPGAEAWSLSAVLAMCCRFPEVLTDCLGNRRTLLSGRGDATAASRPLARVWSAIFACCEDSLLQELDAMLTWGPAHTSWASLGTRLKSNGRPLTAVDWRANGIADAAAKMAASRHRAPAYIRQRYAEAVAAHRFGAAVAGVACWEANHHKSLTVDADGSDHNK